VRGLSPHSTTLGPGTCVRTPLPHPHPMYTRNARQWGPRPNPPTNTHTPQPPTPHTIPRTHTSTLHPPTRTHPDQPTNTLTYTQTHTQAHTHTHLHLPQAAQAAPTHQSRVRGPQDVHYLRPDGPVHPGGAAAVQEGQALGRAPHHTRHIPQGVTAPRASRGKGAACCALGHHRHYGATLRVPGGDTRGKGHPHQSQHTRVKLHTGQRRSLFQH
jgi:hypothetical protein